MLPVAFIGCQFVFSNVVIINTHFRESVVFIKSLNSFVKLDMIVKDELYFHRNTVIMKQALNTSIKDTNLSR